MDIESELKAVAVEQRAYAIVLESFLSRLAAGDPTMRFSITEAFNQAEDVSDDVAVELGNRHEAVDTMKLRATIREIRKMVLGDEGRPRGLI